jgi:hypothetical protein
MVWAGGNAAYVIWEAVQGVGGRNREETCEGMALMSEGWVLRGWVASDVEFERKVGYIHSVPLPGKDYGSYFEAYHYTV